MNLDALLGESVADARRRERAEFDRLAAPFEKSLVLFGAGTLGRQVLACLRRDGIEPLAFADNNPALHGTSVEGVRVLAPREAATRHGSKAAFVVTIWNTHHTFVESRAQLSDLGCAKVVSAVPLRWKYAEALLPFFWLELPSKTLAHREAIERTLSLWADERSNREYVAQLRFRLRADFDALPPPAGDSYFPDGLFALRPDETFVDCGAYDGITVRQFLARQPAFRGRVVAYEPDPANYRSLTAWADGLDAAMRQRVTLLPQAVGATRGRVRFDATGTMGSTIKATGGVEVDCVTLDESLDALQLRPTYVKMDIEGAEYDALAGCREVTAKHRPIFAICLYHCFDDLWRIPALFDPLYHLHLRPHETEGWQLVCYAVPRERTAAP